MFYKYKWVELAYSFSCHIVVVTWISVLCAHLGDARGKAWMVSTINQNPLLMSGMIAFIVTFAFIFAYAMLCSTAVLMLFLKQYKTAERLYKLTLSIRQKLPLAGSTARTDVWYISLANCYQAQHNYIEAERLYNRVLQNEKTGSALDQITNYGLKAVARENYEALLEETGRNEDARIMRANIDSSAKMMRLKYAIVSLLVLCFGTIFACWENSQLDAILDTVQR